jgi:hypothetical protein
MKVDSQEFVNAYIERQQRAIADLTNKIVMLETQLVLAQKMIADLQPKEEEQKQADDFESAKITKPDIEE